MPTATLKRRPAAKKAKARKPATRVRKPLARAGEAADRHNGISSAAVEKATGRSWKDWFKVLDAFTKSKGEHAHYDAAAFIHDKHRCPEWWSQMVTVGYEQARGIRVRHQRPDGFSISASRVIRVPLAEIYKAWQPPAPAAWLPDPDDAGFTVRKATANRSMRITWGDGKTNLEVMFYDKGPRKGQVTVQHNKLKSAAAGEKMKAYWGKALDALKARLE